MAESIGTRAADWVVPSSNPGGNSPTFSAGKAGGTRCGLGWRRKYSSDNRNTATWLFFLCLRARSWQSRTALEFGIGRKEKEPANATNTRTLLGRRRRKEELEAIKTNPICVQETLQTMQLLL
jgi:hypothetical protein